MDLEIKEEEKKVKKSNKLGEIMKCPCGKTYLRTIIVANPGNTLGPPEGRRSNFTVTHKKTVHHKAWDPAIAHLFANTVGNKQSNNFGGSYKDYYDAVLRKYNKKITRSRHRIRDFPLTAIPMDCKIYIIKSYSKRYKESMCMPETST
jgi:hypothetical protein